MIEHDIMKAEGYIVSYANDSECMASGTRMTGRAAVAVSKWGQLTACAGKLSFAQEHVSK